MKLLFPPIFILGCHKMEHFVSKTIVAASEIHLDNQLLPVVPLVPTNKLERLAIECLHNDMQLPCKEGQKWYCQYEEGRWRKHKCKLLLQLPYQSKTFKKCACFTSEGLVYKRVPVSCHLFGPQLFFNQLFCLTDKRDCCSSQPKIT